MVMTYLKNSTYLHLKRFFLEQNIFLSELQDEWFEIYQNVHKIRLFQAKLVCSNVLLKVVIASEATSALSWHML
jgi:hypothetical protein